MPVIVLLVIIAVVAVCAAAFFGYRAYKHRTLAEKLDKRDDDQVHYAFIVNPSKPQAEQRKQHIKEFCEAKHLTQIEFIETQLDKDGRACAFEALDHGADVVVAVGGDGTVRTVASALSGTGHALGIVPIGTGNLFARNMGIPVDDIDAALTVATSHGSRLVDVGRLTLLDDETTDHGHAFLIIAGIGFDALMIDDTDPELKKNISWREESVRPEVQGQCDHHQRRRQHAFHAWSHVPHVHGGQLRPDPHVFADARSFL